MYPMRDIVTDVVNLTYPMPDPPDGDADENERDGHWAWSQEVEAQRRALEAQLRPAWEEADADPLIRQLGSIRREMDDLEEQLRRLLAYGREFVGPRPYTLDQLAGPARMSISGVRQAYGDHEIAEVTRITGARPRNRPTADAS